MTWNSISFRKRLLIIMTLSGLIELLLLVAAGFVYVKHSQEEEVGLKALGVASFLAQSPNVINMLQTGHATSEQQERFRDLTQLIGAAFISIGDGQGIRLVHPLDERVGEPMVGGDNYRALIAGESYISYAKGSLGKSVRGNSAIRAESGQILGVVSVGYLLDHLQHRVEPFLIYLTGMALLVVAANVVVSSYISRRFQKAILGFEPEEISRLYVELDVTMSTIKEGVLSIDSKGYLRSINKSACEILGLDKALALNRLLTESLPDSDLYTILQTGETDKDVELYINNKRLIANRSAIIVDGKVVGAVSSFRLRDENRI